MKLFLTFIMVLFILAGCMVSPTEREDGIKKKEVEEYYKAAST